METFSHRIEKAVFASRLDIMQLVSVVAQNDKGRNWNAKHIEHNHGDLYMSMRCTK